MKSIKRNKNDKLHIEIQNYLTTHSWYKHKVVQDYLRDTYNWVCCYCESIFEHSAYMNIEHFYPKDFKNEKDESIYENYEKILYNLHYSCPKCNSLKNAKCPNWTKSNNPQFHWKKIYSPNFILKDEILRIWTQDDFELSLIKVEDKFKYNKYIMSAEDTSNEYANWTIQMFDLNWTEWRVALLNERKKEFINIIKILNQVDKILYKVELDNNFYFDDILNYFFDELNKTFKNDYQYSSMNNKLFYGLYEKLKNKYEQLKRTRLNP